MRCLIIEDDAGTAQLIIAALRRLGHVADHAHDAVSAKSLTTVAPWDVIVLDRLLPNGVDGLTILEDLRRAGDQTPVLVLSALSSLDDRVRALRTGSDDYLVKPFALEELLARLEAMSRRSAWGAQEISIANVRLDLFARKAYRGDQPIALQPREFKLLEFLVKHQGRPVTRRMLLESVWDIHFEPETNVIDVQISRLRNKVDKGFHPAIIQTIRGVGFMARASDDV